MKKTVLLLMMGILLIAGNVYAGAGDLFVEGDLGVGTKNPDANLHVEGTVKIFGDWVTMSANTVYQAQTDGFIVAWSGASYWRIRTDSLNPPETVVIEAEGAIAMAARPNATVPVRKGDYWKVEVISGAIPVVRFIPFGI